MNQALKIYNEEPKTAESTDDESKKEETDEVGYEFELSISTNSRKRS
jgi:hypothetical protein